MAQSQSVARPNVDHVSMEISKGADVNRGLEGNEERGTHVHVHVTSSYVRVHVCM